MVISETRKYYYVVENIIMSYVLSKDITIPYLLNVSI